MISNNKILTVSYGTFSCTLEGFDDSFGTMKAIAEYFRDLASEDRYFGAQPPQPDAEMLARIAQKDMSRRVEAREHDGKIILSALEDGTEPEIQAATSDSTNSDEVDINTAVEAAALAQDDIQSDEIEAEDTAPDTAVAAETVDVNTEDHAPRDAQETTEEPLSAMADVTTDQRDASADEDENDIVPGQPDAEVEAFFDAQDDDVSEPDQDEETAQQSTEAGSGGTIADKLQRIRSVVAQQADTRAPQEYVEDQETETAADATEEAKEVVADARADLEDALDADDVAEAATLDEAATAQDDPDDVEAILSRLEAFKAEKPAAPPQNDEILSEDTLGDDADDLDAEDTSIEDTVGNLFSEDDQPAEPATDAEDHAAASAPVARVIKVKRSDLEAAIERGELVEYDDDDEANDDGAADVAPEAAPDEAPSLDDLAPARRKKTALTPDAEAELSRELVQLEADTAAEAESGAEKVNQAQASVSPRRVLPSIDEGNEADVNRLLVETDHQMDEPESATRRDAFKHMRAAVAAKQADNAVGDAPVEGESDDAYRNDLADVVRPRRPVATEAQTPRPEEERAAPLRLVAEQRVDTGADAETAVAAPIQPRRVPAATPSAAEADDTNDVADPSSFSDFAADVGARSIPELLEAAAAYMSFVEGRDNFSRQQLMRKLRQANGSETFTREDSLRSFGQLLREGKLQKIEGGRFGVSDDINYGHDARAAG